jgi:methylated-DNA-[protein]-cysteine S-methyltransferase
MGMRQFSTLPLTVRQAHGPELRRGIPHPSRLSACVFHTPWGWMGVSETAKGIDAVVLPKASRQAVLSELGLPSAQRQKGRISPRLCEARAQLIDYLSGTRRSFDLPLDLSRGTGFRQKVWRTLLRIPYSRLRSYQWVAARVGGRQYARAVGNAVGANPMPILIPCHRIVAQDMSIGGFSCGLPAKRKLLTLEGTLQTLRGNQS